MQKHTATWCSLNGSTSGFVFTSNTLMIIIENAGHKLSSKSANQENPQERFQQLFFLHFGN